MNQNTDYCFRTLSQWKACCFARAEAILESKQSNVVPYLPFDHQPQFFPGSNSRSPVSFPNGKLYWVNEGFLNRLEDLSSEETLNLPICCPEPFLDARRIVRSASMLWSFGPASGDDPKQQKTLSPMRVISCHELDTLTLLQQHVLDEEVIDISSGPEGSLFALVKDVGSGKLNIRQYDSRFRAISTVEVCMNRSVQGMVYLERLKRFAILSRELSQTGAAETQFLSWFGMDGGKPVRETTIIGNGRCFQGDCIATDHEGKRIFIAGGDYELSENGAEKRRTSPLVVIADDFGFVMDRITIESKSESVLGISANANSFAVGLSDGLYAYTTTHKVPVSLSYVDGFIVTPLLQAPDTNEQAGPWLRLDAIASLPRGALLSIHVLATDDTEVKQRVVHMMDEDSLPIEVQASKILSDPDLQCTSMTIHGEELSTSSDIKQNYSVPLFDIRVRYVWIVLKLASSSGSYLPLLHEMKIYRGKKSLMKMLPSVYQRIAEEPGSFLRSFVGVLETTSQEIDAKISRLGSFMDPSSTDESWLDFMSQWLELPWDQSMDFGQKKRIIENAEQIASSRGTRHGLEVFLSCIAPDLPHRFRVTDFNADFGIAIVGGSNCDGSRLPAMLAGPSPTEAHLESMYVGMSKLYDPDDTSDGQGDLIGAIRIEIYATAKERAAWKPWLEGLLNELMPIGANLRLFWVGPHVFAIDQLGDSLQLREIPTAKLGDNTIFGQYKLAAAKTRLSDDGPSISLNLN